MPSEKLAIVVSETYPEITSKMLEAAQAHAKSLGAVIVEVIKVPGCFDMPLAVKKLLQRNCGNRTADGDGTAGGNITSDGVRSDQAAVNGVVTLGAIIQGETDHDALIAYTVAAKISELSLQFNKPVTLGISGPKMTRQQAIERIDFFGKNSVDACVKMVQRIKYN